MEANYLVLRLFYSSTLVWSAICCFKSFIFSVSNTKRSPVRGSRYIKKDTCPRHCYAKVKSATGTRAVLLAQRFIRVTDRPITRLIIVSSRICQKGIAAKSIAALKRQHTYTPARSLICIWLRGRKMIKRYQMPWQISLLLGLRSRGPWQRGLMD